jgi:hypothetical protein
MKLLKIQAGWSFGEPHVRTRKAPKTYITQWKRWISEIPWLMKTLTCLPVEAIGS